MALKECFISGALCLNVGVVSPMLDNKVNYHNINQELSKPRYVHDLQIEAPNKTLEYLRTEAAANTSKAVNDVVGFFLPAKTNKDEATKAAKKATFQNSIQSLTPPYSGNPPNNKELLDKLFSLKQEHVKIESDISKLQKEKMQCRNSFSLTSIKNYNNIDEKQNSLREAKKSNEKEQKAIKNQLLHNGDEEMKKLINFLEFGTANTEYKFVNTVIEPPTHKSTPKK